MNSPTFILESAQSQNDQDKGFGYGQIEKQPLTAQHENGQIVGVVRVNDGFFVLPLNHPESSGFAATPCHRITRFHESMFI